MRIERESDLHRLIATVCKLRGWYFIHSRMDKRTTCNIGAPDFVIALPGGRTLWVEAKTSRGKMTPEQERARDMLIRLGHRQIVVRSIDEFISDMDRV